MAKVDLHLHTYYSDGTLSPRDVVKIAKERKLEAIAITDHETILGMGEALKYGKTNKIEVISGIEIGARVNCSKDSVHLLGYFFDIENKKLNEFCKNFARQRKNNTIEKIKLVNDYLKVNINYEEAKAKTHNVPGTPHIARVLLNNKYIKDIAEGIKLFTKGGPCHLSGQDEIHVKDAIKIIHDAGGIAVLAHLAAYKNENKFINEKEQEELVKELKSYGLDGIEIIIPELNDVDKIFGKKLAKKYGLIITGGSDFHDEKFLPTNKIGCCDINYSVVKEIKNKLK